MDLDGRSNEDLIAYAAATAGIPAAELQAIGDELQRRQLAEGEPDWTAGMWAGLMAADRRPDEATGDRQPR